jgi:uncharacterized protein YuzE
MKVPIVEFYFKNGKQLGLDLRYWQIDEVKSNEDILIFVNEHGEMISVVIANVNWMSTMLEEMQEHPTLGFDAEPWRRRLDPR